MLTFAVAVWIALVIMGILWVLTVWIPQVLATVCGLLISCINFLVPAVKPGDTVRK